MSAVTTARLISVNKKIDSFFSSYNFNSSIIDHVSNRGSKKARTDCHQNILIEN